MVKHPRIGFTGEAKEYDLIIIRAHPLTPFLQKRNHHTGLPIPRHSTCPSSNVTETCESRQSLHILTWMTWMALSPRSILTSMVTSCHVHVQQLSSHMINSVGGAFASPSWGAGRFARTSSRSTDSPSPWPSPTPPWPEFLSSLPPRLQTPEVMWYIGGLERPATARCLPSHHYWSEPKKSPALKHHSTSVKQRLLLWLLKRQWLTLTTQKIK